MEAWSSEFSSARSGSASEAAPAWWRGADTDKDVGAATRAFLARIKASRRLDSSCSRQSLMRKARLEKGHPSLKRLLPRSLAVHVGGLQHQIQARARKVDPGQEAIHGLDSGQGF